MNLRTLLEFEEGRKNKAYKCPNGHWTIGVGHRITSREFDTYQGVMTDTEIDDLLGSDIAEAKASAIKYTWFNRLNDARQAVIISMIFQLGSFGFSRFQNTIKLIAKERYESAADQMLMSLWAKQTPERAKRHAEQFRSGKWCEQYKGCGNAQ